LSAPATVSGGPTLSFPEWRGEPLAGRSILIWPEQGFGDQIMFARFAAPLVAAGAQVTMLTPPPLMELLSPLPVTRLAAAGSVAIPRHDFWIMAGSIPGRLGIDLRRLPAEPYLPGRADGKGIGVAWRGDPRHHNDQHRSLPPDLGHALVSLPGARSLLPEDSGARDFRETAAMIDALALVITVDTSIAHLAGAMGKPVWILLPHANPDWRWMRAHSDSPWYPSARLFRQPAPETWPSVISDVRRALADAAEVDRDA